MNTLPGDVRAIPPHVPGPANLVPDGRDDSVAVRPACRDRPGNLLRCASDAGVRGVSRAFSGFGSGGKPFCPQWS
jgi:hypothetical protein